jgi:NADH:ubiquinone oxidoreductase subunit 6 (subunit J)
MAASGVLIARAAFVGHLPVLGVVSAVAMAILSALTWSNGQASYRERREAWMPQRLQTAAFGLLTAATVLIAAIAIVVTVAI